MHDSSSSRTKLSTISDENEDDVTPSTRGAALKAGRHVVSGNRELLREPATKLTLESMNKVARKTRDYMKGAWAIGNS
jgi:hypothetical protein